MDEIIDAEFTDSSEPQALVPAKSEALLLAEQRTKQIDLITTTVELAAFLAFLAVSCNVVCG